MVRPRSRASSTEVNSVSISISSVAAMTVRPRLLPPSSPALRQTLPTWKLAAAMPA